MATRVRRPTTVSRPKVKSDSQMAREVFESMLVKSKYTYDSSSSDRQYEVRVAHDGKIGCQCRGWTQKAGRQNGHAVRYCWHIENAANREGKRLCWDDNGYTYLEE